MMISVLISILLQLGVISNVSEFDESKVDTYTQKVNASIIITDDNEI